MKNLVLWMCFFPIALIAQTPTVYTIQIGTFVNPKITEFHSIKSAGFVYAIPFQDKFSKVFYGEYRDALTAQNALKNINSKGFGGFVTQRKLNNAPPTIVVQFTTKKIGTPIDWADFNAVGKLYTILNTTLLHEVGDFERGVDKVKRDLNTAVEGILSDGSLGTKKSVDTNSMLGNIPASFDAPSTNIESSSTNNVPVIRPLIKRTSALDLQKVLKLNNHYKGSLDGFYGKGTAAGYQNFIDSDLVYKKYVLFDSYFSQEKGGDIQGFQGIINTLLQSPNTALIQLSNNKLPLAKAYQAYWLIANNQNLAQINQLMNAAIKETFADKKIKNAPPFDFNVNYSYEDLTQFFLHLRYLHAAPKNANYSIPCWLFEHHPKAAFAAFKANSKFASFANTKISACKNFDNWLPIKMMNTIVEALQPTTLSVEQQAHQNTLATARNFQYLFPEKLNKSQKTITDKWLRDFWKQMESSANNYPVLGKNITTLKVLFFESQVLISKTRVDILVS